MCLIRAKIWLAAAIAAKEEKMSKGGSGSRGGTGKSSGANQGGRPSSHPGPGGNWPSTTGNQSGGDRGNAPAKK